MPRILDNINKANDIKSIKPQDYKRLAKEIRSFLISNVSKTGGHLASNLGVVELTMALHLFMDFPKDKLIWDVGHQSYTHKLLTGRKDQFATLRQLDGISGFPKREESECDAFDTGHSSTAISAALGMVKARDLKGLSNKVVAVIGDGALTGGMAFEALNNAGRLKSNMIIILNDNNMSISENVGGMANYLAKLRTNTRYTGFKESMENALTRKIPGGREIVHCLKRSKDAVKYFMLPNMLFEDMGLTYIGPIDGHNINSLLSALKNANRANKAVVIHVITKKGKGYIPAEKNPSRFHGIDPFYIDNGEPVAKNQTASYTKVFSSALVKMGKKNNKLVAITAAMPYGTGLSSFKKHFPDRFFDVGIAEEHAVTFAAGMAAEGFRPVVAIYSTFLQRSYDQIIHDVCINNLPVIFAIDRAGITGRDGKTHQGIFDLSYLSHIPNLVVMAPKNKWELEEMLEFALSYEGPVAIRYPKGEAYTGLMENREPIRLGKSEIIDKAGDIAILAVGSMVKTAVMVKNRLNDYNIKVTLVNTRFVSPMDCEILEELSENHNVFITMEENVRIGGYGQQVSDFLCRNNKQDIRHINISLPDKFIEHGGVSELFERLDFDAESITRKILDELQF
ncbi:1-deoxy-D-xylulose-5-phosphate synthase [Herbinix luporum]|uniref:1-deoxy-D-xylulose-5-phosphate synthase n=1 Tax=Herbinix luporum TaxID=1679721 RepID=A0A0K8J752_9FIRM|nr:1-deoxy-D-xylulose-5-phosphate synthase [Herbinix luporum]CUH93269.1 1-deoxy-D-xylulose-5-phosphate synthase [Herbinix luporum]HHT57817.1 1-deoxy-D-xylulose-5-phosphate synthase [Herbinix luporum]